MAGRQIQAPREPCSAQQITSFQEREDQTPHEVPQPCKQFALNTPHSVVVLVFGASSVPSLHLQATRIMSSTSQPPSGSSGFTASQLAHPRKSPQPWSPVSWTTKPIHQEAVYEDQKSVEKSLSKLTSLPPIVTPTEIVKLKESLRDVALGKAFLLQGGDCAELFDYCEENAIESKIKLLLQMSLVLIWGANKPVVRIARMAGQYAKPRSKPTEMVDGKETNSFRGDILNGYPVDERALDPSRLVR